MSIFDDILTDIRNEMPKINDFTVNGFTEKGINESPEFLKMIFEQSGLILGGLIKLEGYHRLSPEETLAYEYSTPRRHTSIPTTHSSVSLYRFDIRCKDEIIPIYIYTMNMRNGLIYKSGRPIAIMKCLLEKDFARVLDNDKDGISANVIRINMGFGRKTVHSISGVHSGAVYRQFIIAANLYSGAQHKRYGMPTIVLYMLAKFGYVRTLERFGINPDDLRLTETLPPEDDRYEVFVASKEIGYETPMYMVVSKELLDDPVALKFVVNLNYVLSFHDSLTPESLYAPDSRDWMVMLGRIYSSDTNPFKNYATAAGNIASADHFIDPISRDRFKAFGVNVEDTYDLLQYVFLRIDEITTNSRAEDLHNKRIDVVKSILSEIYGKTITKNVYDLGNKTAPTIDEVKRALQSSRVMYRTKIDRDQKVLGRRIIRNPEIVGDNLLLSFGLYKLRMGGKPDQPLHPSFFTVESGSTMFGKSANETGAINPFLEIDEHGGVIVPDYIGDFEPFMSQDGIY